MTRCYYFVLYIATNCTFIVLITVIVNGRLDREADHQGC